jgi:hypothetical protein
MTAGNTVRETDPVEKRLRWAMRVADGGMQVSAITTTAWCSLPMAGDHLGVNEWQDSR